jgi:hypothetical protein
MNPSVKPDTNYDSLYAVADRNVSGLDLRNVDGSQYDSPLKISHCIRISGTDVAIPQGNENAVDVNVCENVHLEGNFGTGPVRGDQVITVKGGTKDFSIKGTLYSRGKRGAEVQIGNWSDQSFAPSRNGQVLADHRDGNPVRVAIGWAVPFSVKLGPSCDYMLWESLKLKAYWLTKYVLRCVLRIPKGTKGPSWF